MKKTLSMVLVLAMLMSMFLSIPMVSTAAGEMPDGLFLWYTFDDGSGTTVTDASGNGYHGTLNGGTSWTSGVMGGAVQFNGTNGYVRLPNGIFKDLSDYTVATWFRADELREWQRIFDFGSSTSSYAFLTPMGGGRPRYGIKQGSAAEQTLIVNNMTFPLNEWKHVALTTQGTTVRLYIDGVLVGTRTNTTLTLSSLGETTRNYIGRSQFSGDAYLNGRVDDFRVYSRALSAEEIRTVMTAGMTDQQLAEAAVNAVILEDTERVVEDLKLPQTGIFNTTLIWESSDQSVIKNDGTVIRPAKGQGHKTVTLTVTARKGEASASRQISVTVMEEGTIDYTMNVDAANPGINISQTLYGMFYEDINYAADGGLYAELVQNRSFEYYAVNKYSGGSLHPLTAWSGIGPVTLSVKDEQPLNSNNTKYLEMEITAPDTVAGVANSGFDGIAIKEGAGYDFSFWARRDGNFSEPFTISLQNSNGSVVYGQTQVTVTSNQWTKYTAELTSNATVSNARLVITTKGAGKVYMDMVSLFPKETYKNRPNGMRKDLAELIESYKPKMFRFPGGCVVHGDTLANGYNWKNSIGPVEERVPNFNRWGYHQSLGLGFFEYFQFCEDIGAEPFPILPAGVDCRFEGGSYEVATMEEMQKYIDDALDLIEYANGPADSEWGSKRAAAGHPEPFNLKYIGIGNEDWGNDFFTRFQMINDAIKAKYPDIQVVFSSGPYASGTEFNAGWNYAKQNNLDIVDEHYYQNDTFFLSNIRRYDSYDRNGPKVFVGEYACHGNGNDLYSALVESAYLTGIERNADIVLMTSYAPLFARVGRTQWTNADLIWFDSSRVYATPNYYAQKMFANNLGDVILPTTVTHYTGTTLNHWTGPIYYVANRDFETGDVIIKVVNLSGRPQTIDININGVDYVAPQGIATVLAHDNVKVSNTLDQPENVASKTEVIEGTGKNFAYTFKKNSVTVLRLATTDGSEAKIVEIVPTNVTTEAGIEPKLPTTVTAKYDNGIQRQESVVWDSIDPSKYAQAGTFTVEGTVEGTSIKAVANITVIEITSFQPVSVMTEVGKAPVLPTTVMAQYSNGSQKAKEVSWEAIDPSKYAQAGTFTVEGTVQGTTVKAVANITVIEITAVQPVNVKTDVGAAPKLPSTVTVVYNNGSEGTKAVVWDAIDPSLYAKDGTFKVEGTVEGTNIKAVANVTVGKAPGLEEGLVLWYKFNDANGTTVTDSSGSGYNGKLYGTPNWVEGMEGSALSFNGTDNYIEVGDGTALQPSKITVAYWIKRTASMNNA
ncbi:MAG: hypothetical protein GX066_00870, partial [Clostridiaceae bacterium]|nr:hypothetical protein [Clostridiaceae bacterium]